MTTRRRSILVVHSSNEMYGADRMLLRAIDKLAEYADVKVLLPDDVPAGQISLRALLTEQAVDTEVMALPVIRRAYLNARGLRELWRRSRLLMKVFRAERPDVVWCATSATLLAAPIARATGVRKIILHNQEIWRGPERVALSALALWCTHIVAISKASVASLPALLRKRSSVVANATTAPGLVTPPSRVREMRFLVASRWNTWKGHRTLFAAWKLAGEPGILVIAGGRPPIGVSVDVPALIAEFEIAASTQVVGETQDLDSLLASTHFVIVPSDGPEPFGLVAIEAFANARPVIASSGGGLGEVVDDGATGYLFPNRSVSALASVLDKVDFDDCLRMSELARATFERDYSAGAYSQRLGVFLDDAIGEARSNSDRLAVDHDPDPEPKP